ncbi:DUF6491 family protein [Phenylobacterium sp.]|jgi:hypothetical protein|uniref:DUF6491 family protein n=1 Tax=Phenylobacterium sp. TaxID=1871053 RepID=UPI002F41E351
MRFGILCAAPLLAALALAGTAHAAGKQNCFYARNVSGWRAAGDQTVYLRVGVKDIYRLDLMGRCSDIDWNQRIGIQARGSDWICSGLDAEIISPSPIGPQHCPVKTLHKLTPQEAAALPPKARP